MEGRGATLEELLAGMDGDYPGMRFRMIDERGKIREHIKIFVNGEQAPELGVRLDARDEVHIICAISGGMELEVRRVRLRRQDALNKSEYAADKSG